MTTVAETFLTPGSSNIERVSFDPETDTLTVEFKSGRTYDYLNVPSAVYRAFSLAPSAGKFLNDRIKDRYSFEEQ